MVPESEAVAESSRLISLNIKILSVAVAESSKLLFQLVFILATSLVTNVEILRPRICDSTCSCNKLLRAD